MEHYDPLADILQVAAEYCDDARQISKAAALNNLEVVLREDAKLSKELQRRIAKRLKNPKMPGATVLGSS